MISITSILKTTDVSGYMPQKASHLSLRRLSTVVASISAMRAASSALRRQSGSGLSSVRTAGKSGKQIERCVISTFQIAQSLGFKGDFCQWEHLLLIGD